MYVYYQFYANGISCGGANITYLKFDYCEELEYIENVYREWLNESNDISLVSESYFKIVSKEEAMSEGIDYDYSMCNV